MTHSQTDRWMHWVNNKGLKKERLFKFYQPFPGIVFHRSPYQILLVSSLLTFFLQDLHLYLYCFHLQYTMWFSKGKCCSVNCIYFLTYLESSINRLVTDGKTKICCLGFILAPFPSTRAMKMDSELYLSL